MPNMNSDILSNLIGSIYNTFSVEGSGFYSAQIGKYFYNLFDVSLKIKIISFSISLFFLALIVILIIKVRQLNTQKVSDIIEAIVHPTPDQSGPLKARWEEITRHINSTKEMEWKFAVIEADKLVDGLLKSMGYPGETMGERLISIDSSKLASLGKLWDAHKIRNKIVHEPDYFLRNIEGRRAIEDYARALEELQAIN